MGYKNSFTEVEKYRGYSIVSKVLGPQQAEHYSGGDTIVRDEICAGKVQAYRVQRPDRSSVLETGIVATTIEAARALVDRDILDVIESALDAAGYYAKIREDGALVLAVADGAQAGGYEEDGEESLAEVRSIVKPFGYTAEWTGNGNTDADGDSTSDILIEPEKTNSVPYKIDVDMLGPGFRGTLSDLQEFLPFLAETSGRPESDFVVEQHLTQPEGAEEPTEAAWLAALERFAVARPELFPEVY